jgi:hypothetical protein
VSARQRRPQPLEHRSGIFGGRQARRTGGHGRAQAGAQTAHDDRSVLGQQGAHGGVDVFAGETLGTRATAPPAIARVVAQAHPAHAALDCDSSRISQARFVNDQLLHPAAAEEGLPFVPEGTDDAAQEGLRVGGIAQLESITHTANIDIGRVRASLGGTERRARGDYPRAEPVLGRGKPTLVGLNRPKTTPGSIGLRFSPGPLVLATPGEGLRTSDFGFAGCGVCPFSHERDFRAALARRPSRRPVSSRPAHDW